MWWVFSDTLYFYVQGEVVAVVQAKRKKDASDRQESARIAMAHPLKVFGQREERVGNSNQEKEGASLSEKKGIRKMPAPLSENELLQALPELSTGAALAVRSCVDCWRDNRLADSDLISTVRAFSGSSPVLARVFSTPKEAILPYEVASLEDMRVFAMLSRIGSSGSQSCV